MRRLNTLLNLSCICFLLIILANKKLYADVGVYYTAPFLSNPAQVPINDVFEVTFIKPVDYGTQQNFSDVELEVVFTSPSGLQTTIYGFYYWTLDSGDSLWKARFAVPEVGTWNFNYVLTHIPSNTTDAGNGSFDCIPGSNPGFIKVNPNNPYTWVTSDGSPFVPIGINLAVGLDGGESASAFGGSSVAEHHYALEYASYAHAGFNFVRLKNQKRYSGICNAGCTTYYPATLLDFDVRMQTYRKNGIRLFYGIFGNRFPDGTFGSSLNSAQKRLIEMSINRWGAYVDVWQLNNEKRAPLSWIQDAAAYIQQKDPYKHPVTESYHWYGSAEVTAMNEIDVNAPHWYQTESEFSSDQVVVNNAATWKSWGAKPVFVGEQGNQARNWDASSALRMRIRSWTAFFSQISLFHFPSNLFTDRTNQPSNIYIGPEARQYMHVLRRFTELAAKPSSTTMAVTASPSNMIHAYGLSSSTNAAIYVHHYQSHNTVASGTQVSFVSPTTKSGYWIDPKDGKIMGSANITAGNNTLTVPNFSVDLAFFTFNNSLDTKPIAIVQITNPQDDGDLDNDGRNEQGPSPQPFGLAPLSLGFNAGNSHDLDGGSLTYHWDFGDGSVRTGASVNHTFQSGTFFVTLTVRDNEGDSAKHSFIVRATTDPNPNANNAPKLYTFPDIVIREGNMIHTHAYASDEELNNGVYTKETLTFSVSQLPAEEAAYRSFVVDEGVRLPFAGNDLWWVPNFNQAGQYSIQYQVTDPHGAQGSAKSQQITILDAYESGNSGGVDTVAPSPPLDPKATVRE